MEYVREVFLGIVIGERRRRGFGKHAELRTFEDLCRKGASALYRLAGAILNHRKRPVLIHPQLWIGWLIENG